MKIAFTHNLQLSQNEDEAEFDRPETIEAIIAALRELGHDVEPVEVSGSASRIVTRLEALSPHLIFNTAEGKHGRFREAFYPALFEHLGFPFTFSDAYVCAVTLDKHLTKKLVAERGVRTPECMLVDRLPVIEIAGNELGFPLIVKPNFEGSSMGITSDCVVTCMESLKVQAQQLLSRFPSGVLVEKFIKGTDLTVPYLEGASPETSGVLEPASYEFALAQNVAPGLAIYDYALKSINYDAVSVKVPADITSAQRAEALAMTCKVIKILGIRDAARVDFRLAQDGSLHFLEVNALPSLEPGASIYCSASLAGFDSVKKVVGSIVATAAERFGLELKSHIKKRKKRAVRVGITFNIRRQDNTQEPGGDAEAEYDSPETIAAIKQAIESYGHETVELEATPDLPAILPLAGVDVVFNVAEGLWGRTRESQVPALLELLGIPYTGSDTTTMSMTLDKAIAKRIVGQADILTSPFFVMLTGREKLPKGFKFPVMVKPVAEGSSKGIMKTSVVENETDLKLIASEMASRYRQPVLVEKFLPGREFTVALLGERRPRVLPPMEVVLPVQSEKFPIYSFEGKFFNRDIKFEVPAAISPDLKKQIESAAKNIFSVLGCRDIARIDFRLDENNRANFIELNPLPGLTPGFSDFCVIAASIGMDYRTLIGEILAPALRRMREKGRQKILEGRSYGS